MSYPVERNLSKGFPRSWHFSHYLNLRRLTWELRFVITVRGSTMSLPVYVIELLSGYLGGVLYTNITRSRTYLQSRMCWHNDNEGGRFLENFTSFVFYSLLYTTGFSVFAKRFYLVEIREFLEMKKKLTFVTGDQRFPGCFCFISSDFLWLSVFIHCIKVRIYNQSFRFFGMSSLVAI